MASQRETAKGRIKTKGESDPDLESTLESARALRDRENTNKTRGLERHDNIQAHIHRVSVCAIYVLGVVVIAAVTLWLANHMLPMAKRPLSAEEATSLQNVLFSGTVGSVLTALGKRTLGG